jgi:hypothetical protein
MSVSGCGPRRSTRDCGTWIAGALPRTQLARCCVEADTKESIMIDPDITQDNEEAEEMEKVQEDAAEEREENGGYQ